MKYVLPIILLWCMTAQAQIQPKLRPWSLFPVPRGSEYDRQILQANFDRLEQQIKGKQNQMSLSDVDTLGAGGIDTVYMDEKFKDAVSYSVTVNIDAIATLDSAFAVVHRLSDSSFVVRGGWADSLFHWQAIGIRKQGGNQ